MEFYNRIILGIINFINIYILNTIVAVAVSHGDLLMLTCRGIFLYIVRERWWLVQLPFSPHFFLVLGLIFIHCWVNFLFVLLFLRSVANAGCTW